MRVSFILRCQLLNQEDKCDHSGSLRRSSAALCMKVECVTGTKSEKKRKRQKETTRHIHAHKIIKSIFHFALYFRILWLISSTSHFPESRNLKIQKTQTGLKLRRCKYSKLIGFYQNYDIIKGYRRMSYHYIEKQDE